jgi:hypothetical protein
LDSPAVITFLALIFTVLTGIAGLLGRILIRWTRLEDRLGHLAEDVAEDRKATNDRLTYLERFAWPATRGRRSLVGNYGDDRAADPYPVTLAE